MNLGMRLQNKRIECGMLQKDIADRMELSQKTISSWERGRTVPSIDDCTKLSKIFGCTLSELTGQANNDFSALTADDVLSKLPDFSIADLETIIERSNKLIEEKEEKKRLLARIKEYEKRIKELERKK